MGEDSTQKDYLSVRMDQLRGTGKAISFDLYLKLGVDHFVPVFSKTTGIDYHRLQHYRSKGIFELYIRAADQAAFEQYVSSPLWEQLEQPGLSPERQAALLLSLTEQAVVEAFSELPITEETVRNLAQTLHAYVQTMLKSPTILALMLKLVSRGGASFYHAAAVSVFSLFLGRASGVVEEAELEMLAMGGFLHDIGLVHLPKEIVQKAGALDPAERRMIETHPQVGLEQIKGFEEVPEGVRQIIYQHHERPDGSGYPNGLTSRAISPFIPLVRVADGFTSLVTRQPWRPAYSVGEALRILKEEGGQYDPGWLKLLQKMVWEKG